MVVAWDIRTISSRNQIPKSAVDVRVRVKGASYTEISLIQSTMTKANALRLSGLDDNFWYLRHGNNIGVLIRRAIWTSVGRPY